MLHGTIYKINLVPLCRAYRAVSFVRRVYARGKPRDALSILKYVDVHGTNI